MMKKLTASLLALAVWASLCAAPALAAEESPMTTEEGVKPIAWSCDIGKGDPNSLYVEQDLTLAGEKPEAEDGKALSVKGYCATRKDTTWTVQHTGGQADPSYINAISATPFLKNTEGIYEPLDAHRLYLTRDGGFVQGETDLAAYGGLVELRPGESCQFQLPYDLGEGKETLIRLQVEIFYPESGYTYWRSAYCLIDDKAVDAALTKEQETPAAPVTPVFRLQVEIFYPESGYTYWRSAYCLIDDKAVDAALTKEQETPAAPVTPVFTDVAETSPFAAAVAWAVEEGITAGTTETTFSPETPCTHNHILTFLWRSSGAPAAKIENPFPNVDPSGDFGKAAIWAYEQGLVDGKTFPGAEPCTRAQTMTYLWKLAGSPKTSPTQDFADVAADAPYAQAVAWAVAQGITTGVTETSFAPDAVCSRGQIVTFLHRDRSR